MKPGKLTCAGLVAIMIVLPNTLWRGSPPQAIVKVVVRVAKTGPTSEAGREPTHRPRDVEPDPAHPFHTRAPGLSR